MKIDRGRKFLGGPKFRDKLVYASQYGDEVIQVFARDIADYCTPDLFELIGYWQISKILGNPNGSIGWANEPKEFVEVFLALEAEDNLLQREEMKRKEAESKAKRKNAPRGKRR